MEEQNILELKHISKQYTGVKALDDVSISFRRGEVHALMGENGAGKSTLIKTLSGAIRPDAGEIVFEGVSHAHMEPHQSMELGIHVIYQEFNMMPELSVAENIFMGQRIGSGKLFNKAITEERAQKILDSMHARINAKETVKNLSVANMQLVEIAKVLGSKPKIIVMDEPTSALSSEEVQRLFGIIRNLKAQGLAIIYISHHLAEIFEIADTVTIMRDGERVDTLPISEVNTESLVEKMVGKPVNNFYIKEAHEISDEEVLRVEDYTRWGFFHHVNFSLHKGEVLVICGLAGSGRTEIARSLVSIDQINQGKLFIHGKETHFKNFGEAIKGGIGYLSENRKLYGLALPQTVQDNVLSCVIDKYANGILYNPAKHTALVQEKIDEMQVYPADPQRQVNSFSGGNQQKVLMAKWLAADVDILILDEPTRGVDVGAKQTIHDAIRRFVKQGKSVILLSSDLPEVVGLCDRAVILREGHIIGEIPREAITENSLLIAANGEGEYVK